MPTIKPDFPSWAPEILMDLYIDIASGESQQPISELNDQINEVISEISQGEEFESISESATNDLIAYYYNYTDELTTQEKLDLLSRLLTKPDMEKVWKRLAKRSENPALDALNLWLICSEIMLHWKKTAKRTTSNTKILYENIYHASSHLANLLLSAPEFNTIDLYTDTTDSITKNILNAWGIKHEDFIKLSSFSEILSCSTDEEINNIFDIVEGNIYRYIFRDIVSVIFRISDKALVSENKRSVIAKPGSANADVQHFARYMYIYLKQQYSQPLHEINSFLVKSILDKSVEIDYIRKIVKNTEDYL